jgi:TrmH family RNA methyltransferase
LHLSGPLLIPSLRTISRNQLSYIRDVIKSKRTRDRDRVFALEGAKPILELLDAAPAKLVYIVVTQEFLDRQSAQARHRLLHSGCAIHCCPEHRFAQLSDVQTPSGILAIAYQPTWNQKVLLDQSKVFGIYCDQLQDPTNIGTIIRTAAGLHVAGLWLSPNSADVFNPKVVRATAGTLLQLPIFAQVEAEELKIHNCAILAADSAMQAGVVPIRSIRSIPPRTIIAIGSENRGLSQATIEAARLRFTIPLRPGVESLNASAAAAIAMFHFSGLPLEETAA